MGLRLAEPGSSTPPSGPLVPLFTTKFIPSRAGALELGKAPVRVPLVLFGELLARAYATDAHFSAYTTRVPHRLKNTDLEAADADVRLVALVVDVDGAGHAASDAWWELERPKILDLLEEYPGAYVYRTRGGYRIVLLLAEPIRIVDESDDIAWACLYHAACRYLRRRFAIEADTSCAQWSRLFRAPRATRDASAGPEDREIIGDPSNVGVWSFSALTVDDMRDAEAAVPRAPAKQHTTRSPAAPVSDFETAAARWNADHNASSYPRSHGTCPICGYRGGFGVERERPTTWFCFNGDPHPVGNQHLQGWHGDLLDIATYERGLSRIEILRADGYLAAICGSTTRAGKVCAAEDLFADGKCMWHSSTPEAKRARSQQNGSQRNGHGADQRWREQDMAAPAGEHRRQPEPSALPVETPGSIITRWRQEGPLVRVPTGIAPIDELSRGGWPFPWRVLLVGAPSAGKTFVATVIADHMARSLAQAGIVAGILGVDEEPEDLAVRLAQIAGYTIEEIEARSPAVLTEIDRQLAALPIRLYDVRHSIESAAAELAHVAAQRTRPVAAAPGVCRPAPGRPGQRRGRITTHLAPRADRWRRP